MIVWLRVSRTIAPQDSDSDVDIVPARAGLAHQHSHLTSVRGRTDCTMRWRWIGTSPCERQTRASNQVLGSPRFLAVRPRSLHRVACVDERSIVRGMFALH